MCDMRSYDRSSVFTLESADTSHGFRKEMVRARVSLFRASGRECAMAEGEGDEMERRRVGVFDTVAPMEL